GFHLLGCLAHSGLDIAMLPEHRTWLIAGIANAVPDRLRIAVRVWTTVPLDLQQVFGLFRLPVGIGNHCHAAAVLNDSFDARHGFGTGVIVTRNLAADARRHG